MSAELDDSLHCWRVWFRPAPSLRHTSTTLHPKYQDGHHQYADAVYDRSLIPSPIGHQGATLLSQSNHLQNPLAPKNSAPFSLSSQLPLEQIQKGITLLQNRYIVNSGTRKLETNTKPKYHTTKNPNELCPHTLSGKIDIWIRIICSAHSITVTANTTAREGLQLDTHFRPEEGAHHGS